MLTEQDDIALVLLDMVMETDDAGLQVVDFVRKELGNKACALSCAQAIPAGARANGDRPLRHRRLQGKDRTHATRLYSVVRTAFRPITTFELCRATSKPSNSW